LAARRGDDAFGWAQVTGHAVVLAVADGVSATPQAAMAAEVAVAAACGGALTDPLGGPALTDAPGGPARTGRPGGRAPVDPPAGETTRPAMCLSALDAAYRAVVSAVGDAATGATTLVVVVVGTDGRWAASRVGDSDALVLEKTGEWRPVFESASPDDDEAMRTGATDALPATRPSRHVTEGQLLVGEALVVLTDGVAGPLRDGPSTVAVGLAEGLASPPSPLELTRLIDFGRQGCHDDRTALALWLRPEPPGT
jgi:hypothetical protein